MVTIFTTIVTVRIKRFLALSSDGAIDPKYFTTELESFKQYFQTISIETRRICTYKEIIYNFYEYFILFCLCLVLTDAKFEQISQNKCS